MQDAHTHTHAHTRTHAVMREQRASEQTNHGWTRLGTNNVAAGDTPRAFSHGASGEVLARTLARFSVQDLLDTRTTYQPTYAYADKTTDWSITRTGAYAPEAKWRTCQTRRSSSYRQTGIGQLRMRIEIKKIEEANVRVSELSKGQLHARTLARRKAGLPQVLVLQPRNTRTHAF